MERRSLWTLERQRNTHRPKQNKTELSSGREVTARARALAGSGRQLSVPAARQWAPVPFPAGRLPGLLSVREVTAVLPPPLQSRQRAAASRQGLTRLQEEPTSPARAHLTRSASPRTIAFLEVNRYGPPFHLRLASQLHPDGCLTELWGLAVDQRAGLGHIGILPAARALTEHSPNLARDTDLHIQEDEWTPDKRNARKSIPTHITIKLLQTKDKRNP